MSEILVKRPRKRIFFGLSLVGLLGLSFMAALGLFLINPRLMQISPALLPLTAGLLALLLLYLGAGLLLAAFSAQNISLGDSSRGRRRWTTARWMLPVATGLGRLFGYSRDEVQRSFLEVNNALVEHKQLPRLSPDATMLVLLPHCLQHTDCKLRVTADVNVCRSCGRCDIGVLKELANDPRVCVAVATGGQAAREVVKRSRPEAIVAVACERDLTHGICDVAGIPVVGVLNDRPNGPCRDTVVNVNRIRQTVDQLRKHSGE
ncbi:MAG: DUF116 domain-containing protein [bacterium]